MIYKIDGWELDDYDGTDCPTAFPNNSLDEFRLFFHAKNVEINAVNSQDFVHKVPLTVMRMFVKLCDLWIERTMDFRNAAVLSRFMEKHEE